jgi:hypothetical protein
MTPPGVDLPRLIRLRQAHAAVGMIRRMWFGQLVMMPSTPIT